MSPASHMVGRLRELYGVLLGRIRFINQRAMYPSVGRQGIAPRCVVEPLESRLLLSTVPTVLSVNRETPGGAATEASSVTYAVAFSEPVTGVTSADFQLALTGSLSASSTVVVSPSSGYNSVYDVTVNNIVGIGTLGLNLVDNGSILGQAGNHLANASGIIQDQKTFATGSLPCSAAVADMNGDGKPDIVVANCSTNNLSLLLGNGDGTFQTQKVFYAHCASFVAVADMNGDGKPDLIYEDGSICVVSVQLGNGDGTFQARKTFAIGSGPGSVAVADMNSDGNLDLIAASGADNTVSVLLGNGDGTLQAQKTFATGKSPESVAVADVNGDGNPDLVVANSADNTVGILPGNGDGTFQAQKTIAGGSSPSSVAVSDLNDDGKPDLVITDTISDSVTVLLGNGNWTFHASNTFFTGDAPDSVAIADMNGDGKSDLVVANMYDNDVSVVLGNEDGTFRAQENFFTGNLPIAVVAADVNGDGNPDIVVPNESDRTISVLLNSMPFTGQIYAIDQPTKLAFTPPPTNTPAGNVINGSTGVQVAVEDFSGATVGIDSSTVTLTLNGGVFASGGNTATVAVVNGIATFSNLVIHASGSYTLTASDGTLSQATSQSFTIFGPAAQLLFTQQPANSFGGVAISPVVTVAVQDSFGYTVVTDSSTVTLTLNGGTFASGGNTITAAAVNGIVTFSNLVINDAGSYSLTAGEDSLAGDTSSIFTVIPLPPTVLSINRETPAGAATEATSVTYAVTFSEPVTGVSSADFQVALTGAISASSTVVVSPNSGYSSVYDVTVNSIVGTGTVGLNLVDNGSIMDVYGRHLANAAGIFQTPKTFSLGSAPYSITEADLNCDGKVDLAFANGYSNTAGVMLGNGDGTFQTPKFFAAGSAAECIAVADVNGDGKPDLVVADYGDNAVSVLLGNGDGTFQARKTFAAVGQPYYVAIADLNGDGKLDVVVADYTTGGAGVLLGNGDGTFQAQKTFAAGSEPVHVAITDVNGDGNPDLVVAGGSTNTVYVLLGNGDGTFQPGKVSAVGWGAAFVAVADVNRDGKPDLIVTKQANNNVSVMLGNGDGTFQAQQSFATGWYPWAVAVADLNGDGRPDLIVPNHGGSNASILLGNGDGTFQAQQTFAAGFEPFSIGVADVNGDGKPDLVVGDWTSDTGGPNKVSVLLANNSFTGQLYTIDQPTKLVFTRPPTNTTAGIAIDGPTGVQVAVEDSIGATVGIDSSFVTLTLSGGVFAFGGNTVTVAAVNGIATFNNLIIDADGSYILTASDGALAPFTSQSFSVFGLPAKLGFTQQPTNTLVGTAVRPAVVVTVQDSFGTIVLADSSTVTLVLSGGTFASGGNTATASAVNGVATFDNLVITASGNYTLTADDGTLVGMTSSSFTVIPLPPTVLSINRESPTGTLVDAASVTYAVAFSQPVTGVTSADFRLAFTGGTSASSTVTVSPSSGYNLVYHVTVTGISGKGTLGLNLVDNGSIVDVYGRHLANASGTFQAQQTFATGGEPCSVVLADVNGDGKSDLIAANFSADNGTVSVLLDNGDGTFRSQQTFAIGSCPLSVAVADVNGDGKPDIVAANGASRTASVLLGNGDGTFQTQKTFTLGAQPDSVAVTDLNGDGKLDLVVTNVLDYTVSVLMGNGDGTFQAQKTFATGSWPLCVTVADLNGDGKLDLIVSNGQSNNVSVLMGNGDGTFQAQKTLGTGSWPNSVVVTDLNGDGKLDLVTPDGRVNNVSAFLGNGDGTFQTQQTFAVGSGPISVAVADLNGDGKLDLVVANSSSNTVSMLLGNGNGTFQPQQTFAVSSYPASVAITDLNGDGNPDIVVANQYSNNVGVLLNEMVFTGQVYTIAPATQLAFAQQPISGAAGAAIDPLTGVQVVVEDASGNMLGNDTSNVTLTLNGGVFASGGKTVTVAAVNGIATFNNLIISAAGNYTLTASDGDLTGAISGSFTVNAVDAVKLGFTQQPTHSAVGFAVAPAVTVAIQDLFGNTVATDSSTVKLTLNGGTFASGGNTVTASAVNGVTTFANLIINVSGNYTLTASDGDLAGVISSSFGIALPAILSIDRESPTSGVAEPPSVTYAVTFNEPVTGLTSANFQLAFTGGTTASSTVVVSPSSGYNSVYHVTVNNVSGKGTLGLNFVGNSGILDQAGNHLANSSASFQAQQTYATGASPVSVALEDVNGDGKPDLVVANTLDNTVSVLVSNGDGTFQARQTFAVGSDPASVALTDVNGDGKADLVVANSSDNTLGALLGNGDGTFQAQNTFATGTEPEFVVVRDVNGDGKADMVVANAGSGNVGVLLGNGDGTFQAQKTFAAGPSAYCVAIADVNGDSQPDLLVANNRTSGTVSVLLGNGDGTFQARKTFAAGSGPSFVVATDVNGDGQADLVVAKANSAGVSILLGNGDGTFQAQKTLGTSSNLKSFAVGDINGDGLPDLVTANYNGNTVGMLLGDGDGTFQSQQTFAVGSFPSSIAMADLDGDGNPDLVAANEAGTVSVLLNNNSFIGQLYTIDPPAQLTFTQLPTNTSVGRVINLVTGIQVAVQDSDNATVGIDSSVITLTLNGGTFADGGTTATAAAVNGVATFRNLIVNTGGNYTLTASGGDLTDATSASFTIIPLPPTVLSINRESPAGTIVEASSVTYVVAFSAPVTGVTSADFNLALGGAVSASSTVVVSPSSGYSSVYTVTVNNISGNGTVGLNLMDNGSILDSYGNHLANSSASFQSQQTFATGSFPSSVAVTDVNGDGKPDMVVANWSSGTVSVLLGNGDGTFQAQQIFVAGTAPSSVAVADVNGDGKPDLAIANAGGSVSVLLGKGDGTFQPQQIFAVGSYPLSVAVGDLDNDGNPDLVVTSNYSDTVSLLFGNGDGTFQTQQTLFVGSGSASVTVADVNGDGKADLVVAMEYDNTVNILLGNGNGTFQVQKTYATGSDPTSVQVADVNGDGFPDLVVANGNSASVSVLLGNGDGAFQTQKTFATAAVPCSVCVMDLNGDGKPDLVTANANSNNVSVLLGNGDGTFQAQNTLAVGSEPQSVAVADLNGDGKPDLVAANMYSDNVSVLLGYSSFRGQVYNIDQPTHVVFTQPPTGTVAGSVINGSSAIQIAVEDSGGTAVGIDSSVVTLTLNGGTFTGGGTMVTAAAVNGIATFNNLVIAAAGSYTLTASDGDLTGAASGSFTISAAAAAKLAFTQQPANGTAGAASSSAVIVAVQDLFGNLAATNNSTVTLTLSSGTFADGGNTVTAPAVNGIATFTNLLIDAARNYTLAANDAALTGATSGTFTIIAAAAAKLGFTQQPTVTLVGIAITPGVAVSILDTFGNTVVTNSSTVRLTLNGGIFASGSNTITTPASGGIATFNNLVINTAGNYTLTVSDVPLTFATSSSFTIVLPTVLSINRESPAGGSTGAGSVTYAVTFNKPVTGLTSADFQLALTGGMSASSTVEVSPGSGYNSVYNVTVNNISGKGTVGLNLVDNGSILDSTGNHLGGSIAAFQPQQAFATSASPNSVAVADVNGDGKSDIVTANSSDNTVSVLLSNGEGAFQAQKTFAVGSQPLFVAVADVNGDGKPDLAVANSLDNTIGILLGNGDGTFQTQNTFPTGTNPESVAISDVNGDGKTDLVVANVFSRTVGVLLGNGEGTFQPQQTFATGTNPASVAVADVNGDGKPDLIVANERTSGTVSVLLGNGNGTFQAQRIYAVGSNPLSVVAADVNGDGKPDLVVANANSGTVSVLAGNGDGTFQSQKTFATHSYVQSVVVGDVNGDGKPDLVTANYDGNAAGVLLGNGDGTFQPQQALTTGTGPQSVAMADVNGDGKQDLVVANGAGSTVSVLLNNNNFMGQLYIIDQPVQLAFTQPPACTTAGKVINSLTGVQVAAQDSGGTTVGSDSSVVTMTLNGGTFANGGNTESVAAVNGIATFNNLIINAVGNYTLTAADGALTGATSGSFAVCPLGDVNLDGAIEATDIDQLYAHLGDTTGRYDLNGDGVVNPGDVDYLVKTILQTGYADADLNGKVDFEDFQVLLDHWQLKVQGWGGGDWNGDGVTDFQDFQVLLDNWNPNGLGTVSQGDSASMSSATGSSAAAVQATSLAVAVTSADLSAVAAATVSTASKNVPAPLDTSINLLPQGVTLASASMQATRLSSRRNAVRPLRHSAVLVQNDNADNVDLLTQLIKPAVA